MGLNISSSFTHNLPEWPALWTLQTDGTGDFAYMNLGALAFGQCFLDDLNFNGADVETTPHAIGDSGASLSAGPPTDVKSLLLRSV